MLRLCSTLYALRSMFFPAALFAALLRAGRGTTPVRAMPPCASALAVHWGSRCSRSSLLEGRKTKSQRFVLRPSSFHSLWGRATPRPHTPFKCRFFSDSVHRSMIPNARPLPFKGRGRALGMLVRSHSDRTSIPNRYSLLAFWERGTGGGGCGASPCGVRKNLYLKAPTPPLQQIDERMHS